MVVISSTTIIAIVGMLLTVLLAAMGGIYRLGSSLAGTNVALNNLAEAVKKLEGLPERVARLEEHDRLAG